MPTKTQTFKFIADQAKNLTSVFGLLSMLIGGLYTLGLVPITPSTAEVMIEKAIENNNVKWQKKLDTLQRSVVNSSTNNGSKILKTQDDIRKLEQTISAMDERSQITLDLLKELNRKVH